MKKVFGILAIGLLTLSACERDQNEGGDNITIPDFDFPQTVTFEEHLSEYQIFEGSPSNLVPAADYHFVELTSVLFTDYAYKQRLIKVPTGSQITYTNGKLVYPKGTILTKTFYYFNNEQDTAQGKRIIETRLLIKNNDSWNAATYVWNDQQTDASLTLSGLDTPLSWTDKNGASQSTTYHVPTENECMACHQVNNRMSYIGPSALNLNRVVERNGNSINQLEHLQALGILHSANIGAISKMVDYNDLTASIEDRGRAYLAMNCAHCHNPNAWDRPSEREFDFRYETPFSDAGIKYEEDKILRSLEEQKMPLIGTTMLDEEGLELMREYLEGI